MPTMQKALAKAGIGYAKAVKDLRKQQKREEAERRRNRKFIKEQMREKRLIEKGHRWYAYDTFRLSDFDPRQKKTVGEIYQRRNTVRVTRLSAEASPRHGERLVTGQGFLTHSEALDFSIDS